MTQTFVLASLDCLWHYGCLPSPDALQTMSSSCSAPYTCCSPTVRALPTPGSLQAVFAVMDEDGDGRLSSHEMRSCLTKLGIIGSQADSLTSLFSSGHTAGLHPHPSSSHDPNSLDFPQFLQILSGADAQHRPADAVHEDDDSEYDSELLDAFRVFDANHDGFISAAELAAVLLQLGLLPADCSMDAHLGRCQAYIEGVDLDGNGMVDLEEFKSMMMHYHDLPSYAFA